MTTLRGRIVLAVAVAALAGLALAPRGQGGPFLFVRHAFELNELEREFVIESCDTSEKETRHVRRGRLTSRRRRAR